MFNFLEMFHVEQLDLKKTGLPRFARNDYVVSFVKNPKYRHCEKRAQPASWQSRKPKVLEIFLQQLNY